MHPALAAIIQATSKGQGSSFTSVTYSKLLSEYQLVCRCRPARRDPAATPACGNGSPRIGRACGSAPQRRSGRTNHHHAPSDEQLVGRAEEKRRAARARLLQEAPQLRGHRAAGRIGEASAKRVLACGQAGTCGKGIGRVVASAASAIFSRRHANHLAASVAVAVAGKLRSAAVGAEAAVCAEASTLRPPARATTPWCSATGRASGAQHGERSRGPQAQRCAFGFCTAAAAAAAATAAALSQSQSHVHKQQELAVCGPWNLPWIDMKC